MEMLAEITEFARPHRVGTHTTSRVMETTGALCFTPERDGTTMTWDWQVTPRGWLRALGPLLGPLGGRMDRKIWLAMKDLLEQRTM
jgi:hypothetical protein